MTELEAMQEGNNNIAPINAPDEPAPTMPEGEQGQKPEEVQQQQAEDNIPDKFKGKSAADIAAAYTQLEGMVGKQSSEVGQLRQAVAFLNDQLQGMQQQPQTPAQQQQTMNAEDMLAQIDTQLNSGDISIGEALRKVAQISSAMGEQQALGKFVEYQQNTQRQAQEQQAQVAYNDFIQKAPGFNEFSQHPQKDSLVEYPWERGNDPLLYYKARAMYAEQSTEQRIKQAFEQGKAEGQKTMAQIKQGSEPTRTIITKPGGENRPQNQPREKGQYSTSDGLAALDAFRRSQGG